MQNNAEHTLGTDLKAAMEEGRKIKQESDRQFGLGLLEAGFRLIPCGYLEDNQMIVSTRVYEAVMDALGDKSCSG